MHSFRGLKFLLEAPQFWNGFPSEVVRTRRFERLKVWRLKLESFKHWRFEGSKSAGVQKFVHLGMHKLAGVKLRNLKLETFNLSNSRPFELDWLLPSQTSSFCRGRVRSAIEVGEIETLKVCTFEDSTVSSFESSKDWKFESLKVRKLASLKVWSLKGWLQIRSAACGWGREFVGSKVSNFETFQVRRFECFRDRKFERDESSRVWEFERLKVCKSLRFWNTSRWKVRKSAEFRARKFESLKVRDSTV